MNNSYELRRLIRRLVESKTEDEWWDFKKEWPAKEDLLYDIVCLANNTQFKDAYLVIGVDEEDNYSFCDVRKNDHRKNTQNITDFLKAQPFSGDYCPSVKVHEVQIDANIIIDIIAINASNNAPFFFSKGTYGISAGAILTRTMDTNTPKGKSASYRQTEMLWRKHFGLTDTPLERLETFLLDRSGWQASLEHSEGEKEFYRQFPEYTIEHISDDRLNGYEYYHFEQTDSSPHWYEILVRYHQTVIWGVQGVALDGGRYFTSVPERDFLGTPSHHGMSVQNMKYTYCYFIKGSLNHKMHMHLYRADTDDERIAYERFLRTIVVYEDEKEKEEIELHIEDNPIQFEESLSRICPFAYIPEGHADLARKSYVESLKVVRFIQDELERRRGEEYFFKLPVKNDSDNQSE